MERIGLPGLAQSHSLDRRLFSPLAYWQRRRELRVARAEADARLLAGETLSPRTAWRANELTAWKNRRVLARSLRQLVKSADARLLPGATPVNRIAVREESGTILALAGLLEDFDTPVGVRGVLLLDRLLTDGYGPLYVSYRAVELPGVLTRCGSALEARF
jgi:hypothetical protein